MNDDPIYGFCSQYGISKLDVQYRDVGLSKFGIAVTQVLCKLEMSHENLTRLVDLAKLDSSLEKDKKLREKYENVRRAHEAYMVLLKLAASEEPDESV